GDQMDTRLLTVREVAERVRVTEETVRRWLRSGELPGVMLSRKAGWRIRPEALAAFLEESGEHAAGRPNESDGQ
ncbi:MAG: helix-turn-helix domain-containing protein, partial [Thermomicrobiales bacterium]